jgi:hypothetical protein
VFLFKVGNFPWGRYSGKLDIYPVCFFVGLKGA